MSDRTTEFLERWSRGDELALRELIERDSEWVRAQVRRRLGDGLRRKLESADIVQDAMLEVLRYGPKFLAPDQPRFRGLMVRIVENVLRDRHEFFHARRRAMSREARASAAISIAGDSEASPSRAAARADEGEWLRLGLELLSPDDRRVVVLRQWDEKSFDEIGGELGTTANTARMRFQRALARLAQQVNRLRRGEID